MGDEQRRNRLREINMRIGKTSLKTRYIHESSTHLDRTRRSQFRYSKVKWECKCKQDLVISTKNTLKSRAEVWMTQQKC
jgi:hypothetical protein